MDASEANEVQPTGSDAKRAADIVAERLAAAGCRFAFGIPGGETLVLIDAMERAGIQFVATKHEAAAGFMAEGSWQVTGAPGILLVTIGPGLTNAVNAIANAALDRVPLVVLSGCIGPEASLAYTHQVLDQRRLLEPCVKASFTLSAKAAGTMADRALVEACRPRPGPVHLDVPIDVAAAPAVEATPPTRLPLAATVPAGTEAWLAAVEALRAAEWPLLIVGYDAVAADVGAELAALAKQLKAPVIQTYKAKGLLAEDHPWALAAAALSPVADARLLPLVKAADVIVLIGFDAIEMRIGWQYPWNPEEKTVIDLAAVPNDQGLYQASLEVVSDIKLTLSRMAGVATRSRWTAEAVHDCAIAVRQAYRPDEAWGPAAIVMEARAQLPRDTIATVDSGAHRILLSQIWPSYAARTLLQSNGLCTMACALPLAMGAKQAAPDRPVVAFVGDGGLLMGLGELATCAEQGLAVMVVVFVDRSLALIEKKQRESQLPEAGVSIGQVDFPACAEAMGGRGVTATSRQELADALTTALGEERFTVIACPIDARDYDGRL